MNFELWIRNPFLADLDAVCDKNLAEDDLIELRTLQMLRSDFNSKNVAKFWCSLTQAYPRLVKKAMVGLIPFTKTYLCKSGFLALLAIKTQHQNRLDATDDMCVALFKIISQFRVLVKHKQQQSSHSNKILKTNLCLTYFTSLLSCFIHFLSDCFLLEFFGC